MNSKLKIALVGCVVLLSAAFSVHGFIPDDADGDGVPDSVDVCPNENSSPFDRNGDGCIDDFIGGRHIEYWGVDDATISYVINEQGVPAITNGSDLTAIQNAVTSWTSLADTDLNVVYGGTTTQTNSNGLDGVNLVTFVDNAYPFSSLVLAVGLSTSFEADTLIDGRVYRQGEIFDADMVFNPTKTFTVGGTGVDIQSVATHEAGHLFGISHSTIQTATMFYVLPPGLNARSLEPDDELVHFKAYGEPSALANANRIDVLVRDGQTNQPVPGAIVFIIDAQSQDTTGCDYTLPDGTATFPGLPSGSYFVSIYPLNGTSPIGFIQPANINAIIADIAAENFVPESYDAAESNKDDSSARTALTVGVAGPVASANIFTNIDATGPTVVTAIPGNGSTNVAIDGAYRIQFSEPIDEGTLASAFSFRDVATSAPHAGTLAVLLDDSVVVFIPSPPLAFSTAYELSFDGDLEDKFGNSLANEFTLDLTTEPEPPVSLSSLAPSKGASGSTVVINGQGFEPGATVSFAGVPATVASLANHRIVTNVPGGAPSGVVTVTNPDLTVSNALTFTVLTQAEVARGYETGQTLFTAAPVALALTPSGEYAYVATDAGAEAVVVGPGLPDYLVSTPIPFTQGLVDVATSPLGTRVYAVSALGRSLIEINSDPTAGLVFNTILSERPMDAGPRGIAIDPTGDRGYIATDAAEVHVWDLRLGSPTYRRHIGTIPAPGGAALTGAIAVTPSGDRLLFATEGGELVFYDPAAQTQTASVAVGIEPSAVIVDPQGARAYVTHEDGDISVVNLQGTNPFEVQDVATAGSLRGFAITPGASYLYAADRVFDNLKVVDLVEGNSTFRSVVAEIPAADNPVDVAISPDGAFAFALLQGNSPDTQPRLQVTTIGVGPTLTLVHPLAGPVGTVVVVRGDQFGAAVTDVTVNFNGISIPSAGSGLDDEIVVTVPAGATSGPLTVEVEQADGSIQISNPVNFTVLQPSFGSMRYSATLEPDNPAGGMENDIAVSPKGDVVFVRYLTDQVEAFDIRASSPTYHRSFGAFSPGQNLVDIEMTADGKTCFVYQENAGGAGNALRAFISDPNDPFFMKMRPFANTGFGFGGGYVRTSPNNIHALVYDSELNNLTLFDARDVSLNVTPAELTDLSFAGNFTQDAVFHPSGRALYVACLSPNAVQTFDMDVRSPAFGTAVDFDPFEVSGGIGWYRIAVSPDGSKVYGLTVESSTAFTAIHEFDVDPVTLQVTFLSSSFMGSEMPTANRAIRVVPNGNRGVRGGYDGFHLYELGAPDVPVTPIVGSLENLEFNDFDFTPDGARMYVASQAVDRITMFDFAATGSTLLSSGNNQTGVVNTDLAAPIRVRVIEPLFAPPAVGVEGIPVRFVAQPGNGLFKIPCDQPSGFCYVDQLVVATDANGFAEATWALGANTGPQTVEALTDGIPGSPVIFSATAVADPSTLPLTVAEVIPLDNSPDVSVSTSALVTFSRGVDPATIDATSLFIQSVADATKIPVAYGFTSQDSKVSLTPLLPLTPSTQYQIVSTAGILAAVGDPLTNPGSSDFVTQAPPPLAILSIFPPSAIPGTAVVIAGSGFTNGDTVNFGNTAVIGTGTAVALSAIVPAGATPGTINVTVSNGQATSNAAPFTILQPSTTVIDDVIANVASGSAKSIVVSADGALCYAVGTESDVVIPVGIEDQATHPSIPVGDQPIAIVIHPKGHLAYVANFNSGSVSVIDVDASSLDYHTVINTVLVGSNPIDVAVDPDGSRLAVANAGSNDVSIVDTDQTSATYNQVTATITSASSAKSVVISGDGTLYIGTANGIYVVDTSNSVVATIGPGSSAKSIITSADGSLLFALTDGGTILVVDITDGSPSENQVVATIGAGSSAKSIITSADGSLLYIVQEDTDEVLVLAIEIIPGVGVLAPDAATFTVKTTVAGTLLTGDDPSDIAVDPLGSGRVVVTNEGDGTVRIFGPGFGPVTAFFELSPKTLNLKSKGNFISGLIQVAPPRSVNEIDIATVRIFGDVYAIVGREIIGDKNGDGILDLSVMFCRADVIAALPPNGSEVEVVVQGSLGDDEFVGTATLKVQRPKIDAPKTNENVIAGQPLAIAWSTPNGVQAEHVNLEWTTAPAAPPVQEDCDALIAQSEALGSMELELAEPNVENTDDEWHTIAWEVANTGSFTWQVPLEYHAAARLRVTLVSRGNKAGESEVPFSMEMTVPTRLKSFDVTIEDGAAVLRWETTLEVGTDAFTIVRAESENGAYARVADVQSSGSASGATYEVRDDGVAGNRTYWYKLREVAESGLGAEYGPYTVTYRVANSLAQNHPNPFNPTTTIGYSIAKDNEVMLTIYDVAGRKVRTLVNERQKADVYKLTWDGSNDAGTRVASGVYFYKLVAGNFVKTKKMVLLK